MERIVGKDSPPRRVLGRLVDDTRTSVTSERVYVSSSLASRQPSCGVEMSLSFVHGGYMAGLRGEDPDPRLEGFPDYDTAWLKGCEDRESGACKPEDFEEVPEWLKRGVEITVPKGTPLTSTHPQRSGVFKAGRTYRVKIHDVYHVTPAYRGYNGFERPKPAQVVWAGAGGYWTHAYITDLPWDCAKQEEATG